jgi:6-phosphogluconolactonase (cycloisomerase 2 family)
MSFVSQKLIVACDNDYVYRIDYDGSNRTWLTTLPDRGWDFAIDMAKGKIYFIDGDANAIRRMNVDGTAVEDVDVSVLDPQYIAVDEINERIYYADINTSYRIYEADLDGSNRTEILNSSTDALTNCWGLTVSTVERKLFITDRGESTIWKCDFDGSNLTAVFEDVGQPSRIGLDPHGRILFWCDHTDGKIRKGSTAGGTVTDLVTGLGGQCNDLAFNEEDGYLYFTRWDTLRRCKTDGTSYSTISTAPSGYKYFGLAVARQCIPYRPFHFLSSAGNMFSCNMDGSWAQYDGAAGGYGSRYAFDHDNGYIYFVSNDKVRRMDFDGTNVTDIIQETGTTIYGVEVDADAGYVFYSTSSYIYRCSLTGTNKTTLRGGVGIYGFRPASLDKTNQILYWDEYGTPDIGAMDYDGDEVWQNGFYSDPYIYGNQRMMELISDLHYSSGYWYVACAREWKGNSGAEPFIDNEYIWKFDVDGGTSLSAAKWSHVEDVQLKNRGEAFLYEDPNLPGKLLVCGAVEGTADDRGIVGYVDKSNGNWSETYRGNDYNITSGHFYAARVDDAADDPSLGKLYLVDVTDNEILRDTPPSLDDEVVITALDHYESVGDVVYGNGYVFWCDITRKAIIRAKTDGTVIQTVWDNFSGDPLYVAYDEENNEVYWAEYFSGGNPYYRIKKASADGNGSVTEVCNSNNSIFNNCWGLAYVPGLSKPLVILDTSNDRIVATDGTNYTTVKSITDPKKCAVKKGTTTSNTTLFYGCQGEYVRKINLDGTSDSQIADLNRVPTMMTFNPDDDYLYILKTSSNLSKVKSDGTDYVGSLKTYVGHDIRGITYCPQ